jgi:hypothetical protein
VGYDIVNARAGMDVIYPDSTSTFTAIDFLETVGDWIVEDVIE